VEVEIEVQRERQSVWPVVVVGLYVLWLCGLLWWVLAAVAVAAAIWQISRMIEAGNEARQAILDRAELQHRQVLAGDERGTYGDGYPAWQAYRNA